MKPAQEIAAELVSTCHACAKSSAVDPCPFCGTDLAAGIAAAIEAARAEGQAAERVRCMQIVAERMGVLAGEQIEKVGSAP